MNKNSDKHQMLDNAVNEYAVMHGLQTLTKTETGLKRKQGRIHGYLSRVRVGTGQGQYLSY